MRLEPVKTPAALVVPSVRRPSVARRLSALRVNCQRGAEAQHGVGVEVTERGAVGDSGGRADWDVHRIGEDAVEIHAEAAPRLRDDEIEAERAEEVGLGGKTEGLAGVLLGVVVAQPRVWA